MANNGPIPLILEIIFRGLTSPAGSPPEDDKYEVESSLKAFHVFHDHGFVPLEVFQPVTSKYGVTAISKRFRILYKDEAFSGATTIAASTALINYFCCLDPKLCRKFQTDGIHLMLANIAWLNLTRRAIPLHPFGLTGTYLMVIAR